MASKLKWPWLGIAIPCFLIALLSYGSHFFILANFASRSKQIWFECSVTMIWISYYLAIYTNPGKNDRPIHPKKYEWKRYCKKCKNFKGQRTHHCKTCKQCVVMMDHHCPWTMNCVGLENFPHFMRFLFWVIVTTGFLSFQLLCRVVYLFKHKNLPHYMFHTSELIFLTVLTPLDSFVLLSIALLFCRCLSNQIFSGRSQIEVWEMERLEALFYSKRLIPQLIHSVKEVFPEAHLLQREDEFTKLLNDRRLRFEDVVNFPYDIDVWTNTVNLLGSPWLWLWPFSKPKVSGMNFPKNELSELSLGSSTLDMFLSLPWPPDCCKNGVKIVVPSNKMETSMKNGEQLIRRRSPEPEQYVPRTKWQNDWGENLEDFGVDVETDDPEGTREEID
ncbi:hypothetical protein HG535_0G02860 [Zygotorulaspora mrakii]|uniref:Palmitoyltransferase PFA4 n=1 Tax=Zygotorulaspora mrakii TaxID=42260 RepID=A0A7H9B7C7_ZYGMR|nr:uncharacterized protein HG535_0G02860 [Zygotorulaspora mrakii]QLG74403.1 hypothetical protein HG535_0G02860 [Zygotorulaspora mrakii]